MARPKNLSSMSLEALIQMRDDVAQALSKKASELESQLAILGNGHSNGQKRSGVKGRKVPPKFRSRKNPKLTWAGRGATPVWMREEMKAGKLKKDAFLIK
jgi:DNA-binding protein H-NS